MPGPEDKDALLKRYMERYAPVAEDDNQKKQMAAKFWEMGKAAQDAGDLENAEKYFATANNILPNPQVEARAQQIAQARQTYNAGADAYNAGDYRGAEAELSKTQKLLPKDATTKDSIKRAREKQVPSGAPEAADTTAQPSALVPVTTAPVVIKQAGRIVAPKISNQPKPPHNAQELLLQEPKGREKFVPSSAEGPVKTGLSLQAPQLGWDMGRAIGGKNPEWNQETQPAYREDLHPHDEYNAIQAKQAVRNIAHHYIGLGMPEHEAVQHAVSLVKSYLGHHEEKPNARK